MESSLGLLFHCVEVDGQEKMLPFSISPGFLPLPVWILTLGLSWLDQAQEKLALASQTHVSLICIRKSI